jgi:hypothetical protein
MRVFFVCFAMVLVSLTFAGAAGAQDLQENEHYRAFKSWAVNTQEPDPLPNMFKFCIQSYDKMIASGVSPSTQVPEQVMEATFKFPRIHWKGTVKELKENWCEAGQKKTLGDVAARHAPYKANLRGDKLGLVIDERHGHVYRYALPGGKYTDDAKALAAAKVWYLDVGPPSNEAQYCIGGGKRNSVRRYVFDADHKLLSSTQKQYCGDPPATAYR